MSHDRLRRTVRIGVGACVLLVAVPALAADLAYPYPPQPEPGPRVYREERFEEQVPPPPRAGPALDGPRFAQEPRFAPPPPEGCRTIVKRRIDAYGEEVVRRVRVCDEAAYPPPRPHYRPSGYDPGPPPERLRDPSLVPPADVPDEGYDEPQGW